MIEAASRATHQRHWLVFLLFLHTVNTYMDRVCISAAKGPMSADISGLSDQMMGYVFGIFAVGYALFQIPSGWLSDRIGPRRALTFVVVVWSLFTTLTGAVHTANMLGNLGAAASAVLFPFFVADVTLPVVAPEPGTANSFFAFAALLNVLAMVTWLFMNPRRLERTRLSPTALRWRAGGFLLLIAVAISVVIYATLLK